MENKTQTAVEHIENAIQKYMAYNRGHYKAELFTIIDLNEAVKEAKQMENEQKEIHKLEHSKTWNNAINAVEKDKWQSFEQYYEKEYGKDIEPI